MPPKRKPRKDDSDDDESYDEEELKSSRKKAPVAKKRAPTTRKTARSKPAPESRKKAKTQFTADESDQTAAQRKRDDGPSMLRSETYSDSYTVPPAAQPASMVSGHVRTASTSSNDSLSPVASKTEVSARVCCSRAQACLTAPLSTALFEASKAVQLMEAFPEALMCRSYVQLLHGQFHDALGDVARARALLGQGHCDSAATTTQCDVLVAATKARECCVLHDHKRAVTHWTAALAAGAPSPSTSGSIRAVSKRSARVEEPASASASPPPPAWSTVFASLEELSWAALHAQRGACYAHMGDAHHAVDDLDSAVSALVADYHAQFPQKPPALPLTGHAQLTIDQRALVRRVVTALRARAMVYLHSDQFAQAQMDLAAERWWLSLVKLDSFECDALLRVTQGKCREAWAVFAEAIPSEIFKEGSLYAMEFTNVTHPFSGDGIPPLLVTHFRKIRTFKSKEKPVLVELHVHNRDSTVMGVGASKHSHAHPASVAHPMRVIVKPGDLRPDLACVELIREFNAIWAASEPHAATCMNVPIHLLTYRVLQLKEERKSVRGVGLIEEVAGVAPFTGFAKLANPKESPAAAAYWTERRIATFMASVVASFAVLRVLGIRDRHTDNFLIRNFTPPSAAATPTSAFGKQKPLPSPPLVGPPSTTPEQGPELVVIDFGFWCGQKPSFDTDPLPFTNTILEILQIKPDGWEIWKASFHAALERLQLRHSKLYEAVERVAAHEHKDMLREQIKEALFLSEKTPRTALKNFIDDIPKEKKFSTTFKNWLHHRGRMTS